VGDVAVLCRSLDVGEICESLVPLSSSIGEREEGRRSALCTLLDCVGLILSCVISPYCCLLADGSGRCECVDLPWAYIGCDFAGLRRLCLLMCSNAERSAFCVNRVKSSRSLPCSALSLPSLGCACSS
jgi:hypothetical protein